MSRIAFTVSKLGSYVRQGKPLEGPVVRAVSILVVFCLLAATAAMLVVPPKVYSRAMTWDLLFNLSGAWAIYSGVPLHVDVHDPLGAGSFWLTVLGFRIVGISLGAFLVGKIIMSGIVFVIATVVAVRRLSLVPAAIFVLMVSQLTLLPTNTGDLIDDFTFAMSYNLYGWSVVSVLALAMFLSPVAGRKGHLTDLVSVVCLLNILFYLKITYFLAGVGICIVGFVVNPGVLERWRSWAASLLATAAMVVGPWNWDYFRDILSAVTSGAVRSRFIELLLISSNIFELALYLAILVVAVALWRLKWTSFRLVLAIVALYGASVAILSQNAQMRGLPLCYVAVFLLYRELSIQRVLRNSHITYYLATLLILPLTICLNTTLSVCLYAKRSFSNFNSYFVETSNLRGLSVPMEQVPAWYVVSARNGDYSWQARARSVQGNAPLTQRRYVETIVEAVGILRGEGREPGGVALLDEVNPVPFALGWAPPAGGNLWYDLEFPWPSAEVALADVRYVLIPKFATNGEVVKEALQRFGTYLKRHYRLELETESWQLLIRQ